MAKDNELNVDMVVKDELVVKDDDELVAEEIPDVLPSAVSNTASTEIDTDMNMNANNVMDKEVDDNLIAGANQSTTPAITPAIDETEMDDIVEEELKDIVKDTNKDLNQDQQQEWTSLPSEWTQLLDDKESFTLELNRIKESKSLAKLDDLISKLKKYKSSSKNESLLLEQLHQAFSLKSELFSTKASFWIEWIDYEKSLQNYDGIEKIFQKCLRSTPCVSLYTEYIDYIQHVHSPERALNEEDIQKARSTIIAAFDFVLNSIGNDLKSGDLWMRYIRFVKAGEAQSSYEEQQKMDLLRKIYHKAIHIPIHNIEEIWKEYDAFENNLSKLTAKKFIADQAGGYMTARGAIKDLKSLIDTIDAISIHWIPQPPQWSSSEIQMLNHWKRYISWERSNPLSYEDPVSLLSRVSYTYQSALLDLRYFPEIWYDYATFLLEKGGESGSTSEKVISVLRQGINDNPTSLLLNFTLAEYLETRKTSDFKRNSRFIRDLVEEEMQEYLARTTIIQDIEGEDEGERRERERQVQRDQQLEILARVEKPRYKELGSLCKAISLVWIVFMRLTRRSQSIRSARLVFSKARKSSLITSHVFIASALMEYYVNKDPVVAGKIFEVGLKTFPLGTKEDSDDLLASVKDDDGGVGYILRYVDFLICLNDDNNTRALFERALSSLQPSKARPVWEKYIDYEMQYGDLTNLHGIEKRYAKLFPPRPVNSIESVSKIGTKWSYFDIDYILNSELGFTYLSKFGERVPAPTVASSTQVGQISKLRSNTSDIDKSKLAPILSGINVDRYPRPDLSRWNPYKPEPGMAKVCGIVELALDSTTKIDTSAGSMKGSTTSSSQVPVKVAESISTMLVPEQIADFMAKLPRKESYTGPTLNSAEILALIFAMPIPPLKTPKYVPVPTGYDTKPSQKRAGRWDDDEYGGNRRKRDR